MVLNLSVHKKITSTIQDETKKAAGFYATSFHIHASALVFTDMNAGKKKKQKAIPMPSHSNPAASSYL